jgi:serine/threonine protein kinase
LAKLSHPNVVQVYEYGDHDGDVYVAMEFVEGETLWSWQAHGRNRTDIIQHYRQAGAGLAAAHAIGVIHRDFKPTNVLVGRDGRVRVVDFGLAIMRDRELESTEVGEPAVALAGTPGYLAPELRHGATPDERSDQFSFCVALAEALTGVRPGPHRQADRMRGLPGPRWLRRTIARGLAERPDARWPDLEALLRALDQRRRTTRRWAGALLGVGLLAGIGSASVLVPTGPSCDDPSPRFDRVWNPERRAALDDRLAQTGPWAAALMVEIDRELDAHRRAWIDAVEELCASTHNRATRSQASFDIASRCLERNLAEVDSLLGSLATGVATSLAHLDEQLELLDDPAGCLLERVGGLDGRASPDGELIDRAELALAAGDHPTADALAKQLTSRARERDEPLGLTAGLFVQAKVAQQNGAACAPSSWRSWRPSRRGGQATTRR